MIAGTLILCSFYSIATLKSEYCTCIRHIVTEFEVQTDFLQAFVMSLNQTAILKLDELPCDILQFVSFWIIPYNEDCKKTRLEVPSSELAPTSPILPALLCFFFVISNHSDEYSFFCFLIAKSKYRDESF